MSVCSRFVPAVTCVLCSSLTGYAQPLTSTSQPSIPAWEEVLKNSPLVQHLVSWFEPPAAEQAKTQQADGTKPAGGSCPVAPLDPITDPAAQQLEVATGADIIDRADMVPAAAQALTLFESKVASVGGTMVLKSAYRPAAYQKHLQNVWYKWMELKDNQNPGCQELRAQVEQEFTRHRLIDRQHPVTVSDHTRGIAFDATVNLPANAKIGRRRLTLDGLARLAGLLRPAIATDPVHFKFLENLRPKLFQGSRPRYVAGLRNVSARRRRTA